LAILVQSENFLEFKVLKTSNRKSIEFQPIEKPNNRHIIYFNSHSIQDFSILIRNASANNSVKPIDTLNSEIESKKVLIVT
jgi:hypothetical protein